MGIKPGTLALVPQDDELSPFDAATALSMGLVGKVVPHEDLDRETNRVLEAIATTGPRARAMVKRELNRQLPPANVQMFLEAIGTP